MARITIRSLTRANAHVPVSHRAGTGQAAYVKGANGVQLAMWSRTAVTRSLAVAALAAGTFLTLSLIGCGQDATPPPTTTEASAAGAQPVAATTAPDQATTANGVEAAAAADRRRPF